MSSETRQTNLVDIQSRKTLVLDGADAPYGRAHVGYLRDGRLVRIQCNALEGEPIILRDTGVTPRRCPHCVGYSDIHGVSTTAFRLEIAEYYQGGDPSAP